MRKGLIGKGLFVVIFIIGMLVYSGLSLKQTLPDVQAYFDETETVDIIPSFGYS